MHLFRGATADEVWRSAYDALKAMTLKSVVAPSRVGDTHELLHVALEVSKPRERWVLSRRPAMSPAFAIAETFWLLAGSNDAAVLNFWFPRLPEFAGTGETYAGAYGHRLRRHFGIDQIRVACEALAATPESRQVVLQLWDVTTDLPNRNGSPRSEDIPCNICSLLKIRGGRLEWTQIMRSNDLLRGLPHNFVQFTTLQEIMAGWLGVEVGSYSHWSDSLHAYCSSAAEFSSFGLASEPPNTDCLTVEMDKGLGLIDEMYRRLLELTKAEVSAVELESIVYATEIPPPFRNLLLLLGAESARRRKRPDQAEALARQCTNPQLMAAWDAWADRVVGKTRK